jgi:hypothetical protein
MARSGGRIQSDFGLWQIVKIPGGPVGKIGDGKNSVVRIGCLLGLLGCRGWGRLGGRRWIEGGWIRFGHVRHRGGFFGARRLCIHDRRDYRCGRNRLRITHDARPRALLIESRCRFHGARDAVQIARVFVLGHPHAQAGFGIGRRA